MLSDLPINYHPAVLCECFGENTTFDWSGGELGKPIHLDCLNASDSQVPSMPASETTPGLPLSLQRRDQTSNANLSPGVSRLVEHAHCDRKTCSLVLKYLELLWPLFILAYGDDPLTHNVASYKQNFGYHSMDLGKTNLEGTLDARLPVSEAHARSFESQFTPWSNQCINRMIDTYERIPDKNGDIDEIVVRIHRFLAEFCGEKTAFTLRLGTKVDTAGSYNLALVDHTCDSSVCRSLFQLLPFQVFVVDSYLHARRLATNTLISSQAKRRDIIRIIMQFRFLLYSLS